MGRSLEGHENQLADLVGNQCLSPAIEALPLTGSTRVRSLPRKQMVGVNYRPWATLSWDFPPHHWARKDVCGTSEMHESCSRNIMWLMQFSQEVVQCQKRLADVLDPINREPYPHSLQMPVNFRGDYSNMDHRKKEDGISLWVLWMWYQLQHSGSYSWTRNRIRTAYLW